MWVRPAIRVRASTIVNTVKLPAPWQFQGLLARLAADALPGQIGEDIIGFVAQRCDHRLSNRVNESIPTFVPFGDEPVENLTNLRYKLRSHRLTHCLVTRLESLGHEVTLSPVERPA